MKRIATLVLVVAGCAGAPSSVEADDLAGTVALGPQSFAHGTLSASARQLSFSFHGQAGDVVAPDVWPTASAALTPTLTLQGPQSGGKRATLATGAPRGQDATHLAIDGFRLPKTGSYLLTVGLAPKSTGGMFTLRLWMQSSHLPRQESSQVDLTLTPGAAAASALQAHATAPHPWTDAEVDAVTADVLQERSARVALSSAQGLLSALNSEDATDAQRARAATAAAQVIGTQRHFRAMDPSVQAFALWWFGNAGSLLFTDAPQGVVAPPSIAETVAQLVAAWPGAQEDKASRIVQARMLNGVVYGWQVEWRAAQVDVDGSPVWEDFAREWFDSSGNWLAELSPGASEPEDD